jgi:NAD+ synthase (glutamine-hydrolysing)
MRLALAQLDPAVGDLAGNEARIVAALTDARAAGAQLVLVPELAVTGYPPEDLLLKGHFLEHARESLERIAAQVTDVVAIVGFPELAHDAFNSAAVLADGEVQAVYRKVHLPNYGVFDEQRYFRSGPGPALVELDGVLVGLTVCEDIWEPGDPAAAEALAGATLLVNLSASPYDRGKPARREQMIVQRARDYVCPVAFCAMVGGQDELVFDGHSFVCDHTGAVLARAPGFAEHLLVCDVDPSAAAAARLRDTRRRSAARSLEPAVPVLARLALPARDDATEAGRGGAVAPFLDDPTEVYAALVLGLRDYVDKNGFDHVVLGLSGGVDSALVVLLAADALGPGRVSVCVMPSRYSSVGTQSDARTLAGNLGVELLELPIEGPFAAYEELLGDVFAGDPTNGSAVGAAGLAWENLQARIRGNLLMGLSNARGWLVLTTGNKSELSVGYSTLYGDTAGGFAVIKDVPKTLVYALVAARSARDPVDPVPAEIVARPPSAELRPDQTDQDSLPPYDLLDEILRGYVEDDLGRDQLVARGLPADVVERVIRLVDLAEYKRRQNPPGIRITAKAFGRDRRMPITNRYRGQRTALPR